MGLCDPATTLAASDQPSVSQPGPTEEVPLPLYTAPQEADPACSRGWWIARDGRKRSRDRGLGAGPCRAHRQEDSRPELVSLKTDDIPTEIYAHRHPSVTPLHEGPIPTPDHAGIQSINLKDWGLTLEPDVQYRWYISAIRNPDSPSQDIVAGGMIERCEFSTCLMEMEVDLTCDRQSVLRNAARGFWYDAMACLCELIDSNPSDQVLRRQRAALLNQIGLSEVAEWDLRSILAPVPPFNSPK